MDGYAAAFLVIGNEILSGRTVEKNLAVFAHLLNARGWRLAQARVVADDEQEIVDALNALRAGHALVATSGGIGPTHDDITTDSVAKAFGVEAVEHPDALEILSRFYAERGLEFTEARRRMARTPAGADVLKSEFPGAPAYRIENVVVCAGVPDIFRQMAAAAVQALPVGVVRASSALRVRAGESVFADVLATVAAKFPDVEVGSYPREENGRYVCQVVFTGSDAAARTAAQTMFGEYLTQAKLPFEEI